MWMGVCGLCLVVGAELRRDLVDLLLDRLQVCADMRTDVCVRVRARARVT